MNMTQIQTTFGPILGLIAGYFAAWWGIDQATALGVLTAAIAFGYSIYSAIITRKSAIVNTVAAMPEVKGVTLENTQEAKQLSAITSSNVQVAHN